MWVRTRPYPEVPQTAQSVLDVGCGGGRSLGDANLRPGVMIAGVDLDNAVLEEAQRKFPNGFFALAAAEDLPFLDHSFDCVISRVTLSYTDLPRAIKEAFRVLNPEARSGSKLIELAMFAKILSTRSVTGIPRRRCATCTCSLTGHTSTSPESYFTSL
jgi:ubiquinone/menaquinone biosynthesis C-methylase UbiE